MATRPTLRFQTASAILAYCLIGSLSLPSVFAATAFEELKAAVQAGPVDLAATDSLLRETISRATETDALSYDPLVWHEAQALARLLAAEKPAQILKTLETIDPSSETAQQIRYLLLEALAFSSAKDEARIVETVDALGPENRKSYSMLIVQRALSRTSADLPEAILQEVRADQQLATYAIHLIAQRSPDHLEGFLDELPENIRTEVLPTAFAAFSKNQSDAAKAFYQRHQQQLIHAYQESEALPKLLAKLTSLDPELAHSLLETHAGDADYARLFESYVTTLAQTNPKDAIDILDASELATEAKRSTLTSLLSGWKYRDPQSFAEHALETPIDELMRHEWVYFRNWPEGTEPVAADFAQDLLLRHETRFRNRVEGNPLVHVLNDWAENDPDAVQRWIANNANAQFRDVALSSLVSQAARKDYETTVAFFDDIQSPQVRAQLAVAVAEELGAHDPASGIEWMRRIEQEMAPREAAKAFFMEWARHDMEGAMENFPTDLSLTTQQRAVYWIGRNFHQTSPENVDEWLRSLQPEVSDWARHFFTLNLSKRAPELVLNFMQQHPELKNHRRGHVRFFQEISDADLSLARNILQRDLTPVARDVGIKIVTKQTLLERPEEFENLLSELPKREDQDLARIIYVRKRGNREPNRAVEFALEIDRSHNRRSNIIKQAVKHLAQDDRNAAYDLVLNDPRLSQEERHASLEVLNKNN